MYLGIIMAIATKNAVNSSLNDLGRNVSVNAESGNIYSKNPVSYCSYPMIHLHTNLDGI